MFRFTVNVGGRFRRATLEGRPHLVVPCVMLKQGVLNGSQGPVFYSEEEIEKSVDSWNGMPLIIDHPEVENEDSMPTARHETVFNERKVGTILNTAWKNDKLRTECWFDEARTKQIDKRVYNAIIKRRRMEVSTGLGGELEETPGDYEGKPYDGSVIDIRPDHLAVLPDMIGALSVKDGAGLFANALKKEPQGFRRVALRSIRNAIKRLGIKFVRNQLSFSDTNRALCELLSSKYGERGKYWTGYVEDVFPEYVIFWYDGKTWKQSYTVKDDKVTLDGEAVEVRRSVSYVANAAKSGGEDDMAKTKKFDKKAFVNSLIESGEATEAERKKLMTTDDTVLQLFETSLQVAKDTAAEEAKKKKKVSDESDEDTVLEDKPKKKPAKKVKAAVEDDEEEDEEEEDEDQDEEEDEEDEEEEETPPAKKKAKKKPKAVSNSARDDEEISIKNLPKPLRRLVMNAQKVEQKQKDKLIKIIMNAEGNKFREAWLQKQDPEVLEGMARIVAAQDDGDDDLGPLDRKKRNYIGNAGAFADVEDDDEDDEEDDDVLGPPAEMKFRDPRKGSAKAEK